MRKENLEKNPGEMRIEDTGFKSSFKAWIRLVAFIILAVFLPQQVAQAVEYDWRIIWRQPAAYRPAFLNSAPDNIDIPLAVKNILKDISGKQINAIKISPTLTLQLDKPLSLSKQRIEELYAWLKGKPCGSKALYDYLNYNKVQVLEQDIAVMALTIDIVNSLVQPEGNPEVILNSLYSLAKTSEYFGKKLYPAKVDLTKLSEGQANIIVPFIAHLKQEHYVLVTKISEDKVYFADEHKEEFLPKEKFLEDFSGYILTLDLIDLITSISDVEAKQIKGARKDDSWRGSSATGGRLYNGYQNMGGDTYNIPAGFSMPQMPSFSAYNNTPTYFASSPMSVNKAGFMDVNSKNFINPLMVGYTTSSNVNNPVGSTLVWFDNGLDGRTVRTDDTNIIEQINNDPSGRKFAQELKLNTFRDSGASVTIFNDSVAVDTLPVYANADGISVNYVAYQNKAFINNNMVAMLDNDPRTVSTRDFARREPPPSNMRGYDTGASEVALVTAKAGDHVSWNYQTGAYVKPGDTIYGSGKQQLSGVSKDPAYRNTRLGSHDQTGKYIATVNSSGNVLPVEGYWKSLPGRIEYQDRMFILGQEAIIRENVGVEPRGNIKGVEFTGVSRKDDFGVSTSVDLSRTPVNFTPNNGNWVLKAGSPTRLTAEMAQDFNSVNRTENVTVDFTNGSVNPAVLSKGGLYSSTVLRGVNTNGGLKADEVSAGAGANVANLPEWDTRELAQYVYSADSTNGAKQHFANLSFGTVKGLGNVNMDYSPMFSNVRHNFKGNMKEFVSSVQQFDTASPSAKFVAVARQNNASLNGVSADINSAGFVTNPGLISKYQGLDGNKAVLYTWNNLSDITAFIKLKQIAFENGGEPVQGSLAGFSEASFDNGKNWQPVSGYIDGSKKIIFTSRQDMPRFPVLVSTPNDPISAAKSEGGGSAVTRADVEKIKSSGYDVFAKGDKASGQRVETNFASNFNPGSISLDQRNMNYHGGQKPLLDFATIIDNSGNRLGQMQMVSGGQTAYFNETGTMISGVGRFRALSTNQAGLYVDHTYETNGVKTHGGFRYNSLDFEYKFDGSSLSAQQYTYAHNIKQHGNRFEFTIGESGKLNSTNYGSLTIQDGKVKLINVANLAYIPAILRAESNVQDAYTASRESFE
ncbi:MAG: hypothetical protein C4533_08210, partial [Candidatus Omnitrophota bacterium]